MRLFALKIVLRIIIWFIPLISFIAFGVFQTIQNEKDIEIDRQEKKLELKEDEQSDVELPVISVYSRNQFSQIDTDKILEMEEWRSINLQYWQEWYYFRNITINATEFMSIFRNFAMYKMDPNEIEHFTEDQKEFLGYHRNNFGRLIKQQVHFLLVITTILLYVFFE